jgi:uncharacterized protein
MQYSGLARNSVKYFLLLSCLFLQCTCLVNKLSFFPTRQDVLEQADLPPSVREIPVRTMDKKALYCLYLSKPENSGVALYFHGNAENIYQSLPVLFQLFKYDINVFGVDFRGYGKSKGSPSERGIYKDGISAMHYLLDSLHYKSEDIIIVGRSIGTTAACNTAANIPVGRVILISPVSSGIEYAKAHGLGLIAFLGGNAFNNYEKCSKIKCPVLVIAGTNDAVAPFPLAKKLFDSMNNPDKKFCAINGAGHNDIMYARHDTLWKAIGAFLKN